MATNLKLTTADDIVAELVPLIAGDSIELAAGSYSVSAAISKDGVKIIAEDGVIIDSTGDLFVGTVSDFEFTGKAIINSGLIDLDADTIKFECVELNVDAVLNATGSSNINIKSMNAMLDTSGQVSFQADSVKDRLIHTSTVDGLPATFHVEAIEGGSIETVGSRSFVEIDITWAIITPNTIVKLDNSIATLNVGSCVSGCSIQVDGASDVALRLDGIPPSLNFIDGLSKVLVSGEIYTVLESNGNIDIKNLKITSATYCLDSASPITVTVYEGVDLFSLIEQISSNITLAEFAPASTVAWGSITGLLSDQTDLQSALDLKATVVSLTTHENDSNVHLSTDERAAIDNSPSAPTGLNPFATAADIAAAGGGDMLKATYDQDNNGIVDNSEKLGGNLPAHYATESDLTLVEVDLANHEADTTNPHSVTYTQVGADAAGSAAAVQNNLDTHEADLTNPHNVTYIQVGADQVGSAAVVQSNLDSHEANNLNPHSVTKSQVGLGNVDNTSDLNKPISTATQTALNGKEPANINIQTHIADVLTNPHSVTKAQVGLGNVDNTSDLNKPISIATQTALDLKGEGTVTNITVGGGLDISNPSTTPNITLDLNELPTGGALVGTDDLVSVNGSASTKQQINNIPLSIFLVDLTKSDVGLGSVDNTSDVNKPISNATQSALDLKEGAFSKNTAFNKNFGTSAGTVAEGNHVHNYGSDDIINDSGIIGVTVTDALETIDNEFIDLRKKTNSPFILKTANFTAQEGNNYTIDGAVQMTLNHSTGTDGHYYDIFLNSGPLTVDWEVGIPSPLPPFVNNHLYRIIHHALGWEVLDITPNKTVLRGQETISTGNPSIVTMTGADLDFLGDEPIVKLLLTATVQYSASATAPADYRAEFRIDYGSNAYRSQMVIPNGLYKAIYGQAQVYFYAASGWDLTTISVEIKAMGSASATPMNYIRLDVEAEAL